MPHIDSMFPSRYLKAHELCSKRVPVTIARVVQEKVRRNQEQTDVWVVYFHGKVKGLCLNKLNAKAIASLHGPNTESWIGKSITIYGTVIRAFNAQYEVVRVDSELPQLTKHTTPSQPSENQIDDLDDVIDADDVDDDVPFAEKGCGLRGPAGSPSTDDDDPDTLWAPIQEDDLEPIQPDSQAAAWNSPPDAQAWAIEIENRI